MWLQHGIAFNAASSFQPSRFTRTISPYWTYVRGDRRVRTVRRNTCVRQRWLPVSMANGRRLLAAQRTSVAGIVQETYSCIPTARSNQATYFKTCDPTERGRHHRTQERRWKEDCQKHSGEN